jgi:vitamin B12 transporter
MKQFVLASGASLALILCVTAAAQADATPAEQMVVTAARSPLSLSQVGSATTVISREDIERRQLRYVTDLLRSVPGFSISHTGAVGSQTQVRVRGAEANHILVLIDGVRANDPGNGDEFRWEYLTTGNIERIEIVRGPQSSLWGSDAVSAVVHIITKSPGREPALGFYAEGGSNSTLNGALQGSFGSDRWRFGAGIERLATDGTNVSRVGGEDDDSDVTTASLAAQFAASDAVSMDFSLRAVDAYSQFDPVDFFVTGLPTDGDRATDAQQVYANLGGTINTRDGQLVHRIGIRYFDADNENLADGVAGASTASDRVGLSYQADVGLGENLLSLAVEHERTQFEQRGAILFGDPNQNQQLDITSFVADFQGLSLDKFTWLLSARFDNNSEFDNAATGRLSVAYDLADTTTLRASIGTGQKNPTFTDRFGFFPGQFVGNQALKPETSTAFEIGIDQRLLGGALLLQGSLFRQDLKNEINGFVFDPATFLFTAENIPGSSVRQGVELGLSWKLLNNLDVTGAYTYVDTTEENATGADIREIRRPRHNANLSANYRFANDRAQLALGADYGGTRTDIFFPPFPNPPTTVTLERHLLVDLTAHFKVSPRVSLFARGSNLLDEDYEQVFGYRTLGRAGYVGVRLSFN